MDSILMIDDDKAIGILVKKYLQQEGITVTLAANGLDGLDWLQSNGQTCSLVILDVMMPGIDGFHVLEKIREQSNVPVLMLTARDSETDKVAGLQLGADDYLTKPFGIKELTARVQSLVRRYTTFNSNKAYEQLRFKSLIIDKAERTVLIDEQKAELSGKEFDLLWFLASQKGRVFTKQQIYAQVWEDEYAYDDSNIMSFISKLRRKIEPDPEHPFYILTVRGVGYRFNKEA